MKDSSAAGFVDVAGTPQLRGFRMLEIVVVLAGVTGVLLALTCCFRSQPQNDFVHAIL